MQGPIRQERQGWAALAADVLGEQPVTPLIAALEQPISNEQQAALDAAWNAQAAI